MPSIPQSLYNQIMMADDFTCVYCGKRTCEVQVDHIIPRSQGGPDVLHNLVAACPYCNAQKSDHQLHEVGMRLCHGRFSRKASRPTRPRTAPPIEFAPEPFVRPMLTCEQREAYVTRLATQRKEDGTYQFSANKIRDLVGGADAVVKAIVRKARS